MNSLNYLLCNTWGCALSAYPFRLWWLWECVHFILLSASSRPINQSATQCLWSGRHEIMVCAVRLSMFLGYGNEKSNVNILFFETTINTVPNVWDNVASWNEFLLKFVGGQRHYAVGKMTVCSLFINNILCCNSITEHGIAHWQVYHRLIITFL